MSNGMRWGAKDVEKANKRNARGKPLTVNIHTPSGVASFTNKPNKYGAMKVDGCDSKKESRRLQELRLLEKAGKIRDLIPQVTFKLLPSQIGPDGKKEKPVKYTCDALYVENGRLVVEDTKSEATRKLPVFVLKRKLMLEKYGIAIKEV